MFWLAVYSRQIHLQSKKQKSLINMWIMFKVNKVTLPSDFQPLTVSFKKSSSKTLNRV